MKIPRPTFIPAATFAGKAPTAINPLQAMLPKHTALLQQTQHPFPSLATVQRQSNPFQLASAGPAVSLHRENPKGLPAPLQAGIEQLSGYSMDEVTVQYNSSQPAQLQALAHAQGTEIHLGPGQEQHLPHEAWHVVQQKQGRVRPTLQEKGVGINDDAALEQEADREGEKAYRLGMNEAALAASSKPTGTAAPISPTIALKKIHPINGLVVQRMKIHLSNNVYWETNDRGYYLLENNWYNGPYTLETIQQAGYTGPAPSLQQGYFPQSTDHQQGGFGSFGSVFAQPSHVPTVLPPLQHGFNSTGYSQQTYGGSHNAPFTSTQQQGGFGSVFTQPSHVPTVLPPLQHGFNSTGYSQQTYGGSHNAPSTSTQQQGGFGSVFAQPSHVPTVLPPLQHGFNSTGYSQQTYGGSHNAPSTSTQQQGGFGSFSSVFAQPFNSPNLPHQPWHIQSVQPLSQGSFTPIPSTLLPPPSLQVSTPVTPVNNSSLQQPSMSSGSVPTVTAQPSASLSLPSQVNSGNKARDQRTVDTYIFISTTYGLNAFKKEDMIALVQQNLGISRAELMNSIGLLRKGGWLYPAEQKSGDIKQQEYLSLDPSYQPSTSSAQKKVDKTVIHIVDHIIQAHSITGSNRHEQVRNTIKLVIVSDPADVVWNNYRQQLIQAFNTPSAADYYTDTYVRAGDEHEQIITSLTAGLILQELQHPQQLPTTSQQQQFTVLDHQHATNVPTHYVVLKGTSKDSKGRLIQNHHPTSKTLIHYIDDVDPSKLKSATGSGKGGSPDYHHELAAKIKHSQTAKQLNQELWNVNEQNLASREDILSIPAIHRGNQLYQITNSAILHFNISKELHLIARHIEVRRRKIFGLFAVVSKLLQTPLPNQMPVIDIDADSDDEAEGLPQTPAMFSGS